MQHQLPGAEITLHIDDRVVSLGQAMSHWETMDLPSDLALQARQYVLATQSLGGETSKPSIPSIVQATGPTPSRPQPHPDSHIYSCAGNVALGGMTPGTIAEIVDGSTVLGSAVAPEGACVVELSSAVPNGTALTARARTCGLPDVEVTLPRGDKPPLTPQDKLPAPVFGSPVMDCVEWIQLAGLVPGATVVLTRGDGSEERWPVATRSWPVRLRRRLQDGEELVIRQEFDRCRIGGEERRATVAPFVIFPPKLTSPWCSGRVSATNLMPGATLIFFTEDGAEIGRSVGIGTSGKFTVYQPQSLTLHARQELCGVTSNPSNSVDSMTVAETLEDPVPVIVEPVRGCQTEVKVTGLVASGGLVEIVSQIRGVIGWRQAPGRETVVSVTSLLPGEPLQARAVSCAQQEGWSAVAEAVGIGDVPPPLIESPLHAGTPAVRVHQTKIGLRLDVYVDGSFVAGTTVTETPALVNLPMTLVEGQTVSARQGLCDQWREGDGENVVPAPATPEPVPGGFSKVVVANCHTAQQTLSVWTIDHTTGAVEKVDSLDHNYDEWGSCPAAGEPLEVELEDGHLYEVVFVDPDAPQCGGQDDPMNASCRRGSLPILGNASGPAFHWQVN
jgi:hypothetical protein